MRMAEVGVGIVLICLLFVVAVALSSNPQRGLGRKPAREESKNVTKT